MSLQNLLEAVSDVSIALHQDHSNIGGFLSTARALHWSRSVAKWRYPSKSCISFSIWSSHLSRGLPCGYLLLDSSPTLVHEATGCGQKIFKVLWQGLHQLLSGSSVIGHLPRESRLSTNAKGESETRFLRGLVPSWYSTCLNDLKLLFLMTVTVSVSDIFWPFSYSSLVVFLTQIRSFWSENFFTRAEQNFCGYCIRLTCNARSDKAGSSHCYLDRRPLHEID